MTGQEQILIKVGEVMGAVQGIYQKLDTLDAKVEHNCKASITGDQEILSRINNVEAARLQNWAIHEDYHSKNEPLWGIWTLFKRKPIIPIIISLILGSSGWFTIPKIISILKLLK